MAGSIRWMVASLLVTPFAVQAQVTPGQWESTVTVKSMEVPGAPPQVAQMMKNQMGGKPTKTSYCITPEEAKSGPKRLLKQNSSCRFTKFSMVAGKMASEMVCKQNGGTMTVKSNGSYTPKSYNMNANMVMSGQMAMRMTSSNVGRWVGPCKSK